MSQRSSFERAWLIEDDVAFTGRWRTLFDAHKDDASDFLSIADSTAAAALRATGAGHKAAASAAKAAAAAAAARGDTAAAAAAISAAVASARGDDAIGAAARPGMTIPQGHLPLKVKQCVSHGAPCLGAAAAAERQMASGHFWIVRMSRSLAAAL